MAMDNTFGVCSLRRRSTPGRYIYSFSNIGVAPAGQLGYFDPRSSYLPAGAVATYTTTLTLTQDILNQTGETIKQC